MHPLLLVCLFLHRILKSKQQKEEAEKTCKKADQLKQTGLVVQITFDEVPSDLLTKKKIHEFFEQFVSVKEVHYFRKQVQGYIKFHEENSNVLNRYLSSITDARPKLNIAGYKFNIKVMPQLTFAGNTY